jgi:hypothetical protein
MKYMLLLNDTDSEFAKRDDPQHAQQYWAGWHHFITMINEAGIVVKGDGLQPPSVATKLRIRDGKQLIEDGPFADSKEQLGGYLIIEVPDLDTALAWAAKAPSALTASVEIRPVLPPMPSSAT